MSKQAKKARFAAYQKIGRKIRRWDKVMYEFFLANNPFSRYRGE